MRKLFYVLFLVLPFTSFSQANETIGVLQYSHDVQDGINLLTPLFYNKSYLIDNCGKNVHEWQLNNRPGPTYLMENGDLLTSGWDPNTQFKEGGVGGYLERLDWDSNSLWQIKISNSTEALHHDFFPMKNGNVLIIVWERISAEEVLASGRNPALYSSEIFSEKVQEINIIGDNDYVVVWEWRAWDHLVQDYDSNIENFGIPSENPNKINLNYVSDLAEGRDWIHFNSIDYNEENDLILLSARHFNEVWVVDHSTTNQESSTSSGGNFNKGGDLIYRWGNPRAYNSTFDEQLFYGQHDARWIFEEGNMKIKVFNNAFLKGTFRSSVDIITPIFDSSIGFAQNDDFIFLPESSSVLFAGEGIDEFYSSITSGSQYLSNGKHLLITLGSSGHCYEIDLATNEILWEFVNPVTGSGPQEQGTDVVNPEPQFSNTLFKLYRYDYNYLDNSLNLESFPEQLELNDTYDACVISSIVDSEYTRPKHFLYNDEVNFYEQDHSFYLMDLRGKRIQSGMANPSVILSFDDLPQGIYILTVIDKKGRNEQIKILN